MSIHRQQRISAPWLLNRAFGEPLIAQHAFTLIELLVVLAIIAILASLLLTGLARARAKADAIVCGNNLRQISLGAQLYLSDTDGTFPAFTAARGDALNWSGYLTPYVGASWPSFNLTSAGDILPTSGTYVCPGYNRIPGIFVTQGAQQMWGAYAYNFWGVAGITPFKDTPAKGLGGTYVTDPSTGADTFKPTKDSEIHAPSDMIAFGDAPLSFSRDDDIVTFFGIKPKAANIGYPQLDGGIDNGPKDLNRERRLNVRRHSSKYNINFVDGHIESNTLEAFFRIRGRPVRQRRWAADNQPHLEIVAQW